MRNARTFVLLALLSISAASAAQGPEDRSVRIGDDVFVAADDAAFRGNITGDALLAGGEVVLDGTVGGDAVLAGGRVTVRGSVGEDVYAAAGEVSVTGKIGGSARITGGQIEIAEGASIADGVSIAGGQIKLDGHAGRYVQIAGGEVRINGRVDGDVNVRSGELAVGPDAIIEGRLTYRGPGAARVSSSAQVRGGVANLPERDSDDRILKRVFTLFALAWLAGWAIVGVLFLAVLPRASHAVTDTVRSRPGAAILLGVALLCAVPIMIVIVAITIVGIPLALLLVCLYLVLLPLGYLASVATLADWLLPRLRGAKPVSTPMRIGAFILVLIGAAIVTRIPVLGGLIALALILAGMGGVALSIGRWREVPVAQT